MSGVLDGSRIRLLLLHGHVLFRESLARLLASEQGFELVAEQANRAEALDVLQGSSVDIVILDFDENFMSASRKAGYAGKFLIVTSTLDAAISASALRLGASGIFLESGS